MTKPLADLIVGLVKTLPDFRLIKSQESSLESLFVMCGTRVKFVNQQVLRFVGRGPLRLGKHNGTYGTVAVTVSEVKAHTRQCMHHPTTRLLEEE